MKKSAFDAFCRDAADLLSEAKIRYVTIGGLAIIALGRPRTTADFEVIAVLDAHIINVLLEAAHARGFNFDVRTEHIRFEETGTLRLRKGDFQLDLIGTSLPFEDVALMRAKSMRIFGRLLPMPAVEDLLLFKVLAGRDKDIADAVGLIERHAPHLDRAYVEHVVRELCDLAEDLSAWKRLQNVFTKGGM